MFFSHVHLHGGPAPVRRYLPTLIDLILKDVIDPGKVFDLTLPLDQVAEGYRAIDSHNHRAQSEVAMHVHRQDGQRNAEVVSGHATSRGASSPRRR